MSLRRVVFPLPLRPRRTRVSAEETEREISETRAREGAPLAEGARQVTPRNSITGSMEVVGFAFISIDRRGAERDDGILLQPPDAQIWRNPRLEAASNRKGKWNGSSR